MNNALHYFGSQTLPSAWGLVPNKLVLVRPHLTFISQLDPYLTKNINSLESVQKGALKVHLKQWNTPDTHQLLNLLFVRS